MESLKNLTVRLSGIETQSIVDGPGLRFVIFTQGCPHACPGCHNPQTHPFDGGFICRIDRILEAVDKNPLLKGVTFSGGEPFCQSSALLPLARVLKERGKDILCYSGYTFEDLLELYGRDSDIRDLLTYTDILIDGRFELEKRDLTLRFRGSSNQRIIDVQASLEKQEAVEAVLPE